MDDQVFESSDIQFSNGSQYYTHSRGSSRQHLQIWGFFSHFRTPPRRTLTTALAPGQVVVTAVRMITSLSQLMNFTMPSTFPDTEFRAFGIAAGRFFPGLVSDEVLYDPLEKRRHFDWEMVI